MMNMMWGLLGALIGLGLAALGGWAGWTAHRLLWARTPGGPAEARRDSRREEETAEAFRQLQNYSAQQAYGLADREREADR